MNQYNITAQVYDLHDMSKQNLLINQIVDAKSQDDAIFQFKDHHSIKFQVVKIYSAELVD